MKRISIFCILAFCLLNYGCKKATNEQPSTSSQDKIAMLYALISDAPNTNKTHIENAEIEARLNGLFLHRYDWPLDSMIEHEKFHTRLDDEGLLVYEKLFARLVREGHKKEGANLQVSDAMYQEMEQLRDAFNSFCKENYGKIACRMTPAEEGLAAKNFGVMEKTLNLYKKYGLTP